MIIIPAEKRFDSKHPPFILLLLVIINLIAFFVYQSGDNKKTDDAFAYSGDGEHPFRSIVNT